MLKEAYSGSESRDYVNGTNSGTQTGPFRQSYQHDVFGNMTHRENRFWSQTDILDASYTDNRRQDPAFHYDAAGNLTQDGELQYAYDAAGRNSSIFGSASNRTVSPSYDGDAQLVKRTETQSGSSTITYYLHSSILGGRVVTELDAQGQKHHGYVFAGEQLLAEQGGNVVSWRHENPLTGSRGGSEANGFYHSDAEPDPTGVDVGFSDPFNQPLLQGPFEPGFPILLGSEAGCGFNPNCTTCFLDGFKIGCEEASHLMEIGAATFDTWATVRITHTNGTTETFVGRTNLPPGMDIRFTGAEARLAAIWFNWSMSNNFGIGLSIAGALVAVSGSRLDNGRSGGLVGFGGNSFAPAPQDPMTGLNPDACGAMAEQAQTIADLAIKNAGGDFTKALAEFDRNFGTLYAGTPLRDGADARELFHTGGGTENSFGLRGESGFKSEFQEGPYGNDQTHHFATYFSGALNGQTGYLWSHRNLFENSDADKRLGDRALELGTAMRKTLVPI